MKFAHLADCHIGGWRDEKLRNLGLEAFKKAVDICVAKKIDFILISGDLFDTALPSTDMLKEVFGLFKGLKDNKIPVYIIAGSHDFSPSGKTMLEVLEKAGLCIYILPDSNLVLDKSGAKIAGVYGLKGGLEKEAFASLNIEQLEKETGYKIFMFHTAINEFKPANMLIEGQSVAVLPKNFDYYAGGHIHSIFTGQHDKGVIAYPGALFPNNFLELEEFKHGGFYIADTEANNGKIEWIPIKVKDVLTIKVNANEKSIADIEKEIANSFAVDTTDKIVALRIEGVLKTGKPSDINFKELAQKLGSRGAYFFMRNTSKLIAREFEGAAIIQENAGIEDIETKIITECKNSCMDFTEETIKAMIKALGIEKSEGQKNIDFENQILTDSIAVLKLGGIWNAIAQNKA